MSHPLESLRVRYSIANGQYSTGIVLDQITRKEKVPDAVTVSAYSVLDDLSLQIVHPVYWRILCLIDKDDNPCTLKMARHEAQNASIKHSL